MDQETLTDILAQILNTSSKWQQEVERNVMLQDTIEDLFRDEIFQVLLGHLALPKFEDTNIPHFRAIELICSFRELAHQIAEGGANEATVAREFEDLMFTITDKWGTGAQVNVSSPPAQAVPEAERIVKLYQNDRQFSARLDRFRLLVLPLGVGSDGDRTCQILILENVRSPRSDWKEKKK